MSVFLSSPSESVSRPTYVLPNSQDIRVNQGKRGREDDSSDGVPVVGSVKRVKSLEPVGGGPRSTPRAIKDTRKSGKSTGRVRPSISSSSEYLDAMFGYSSEKHYEYGSDSDEEDPPSDPEEPMLTSDEDADSPTDVDEDQAMADISEETFRAEMDQIFVGSDELVKTFFATDSDGELADDESDINVEVEDKARKPKFPTAPVEKRVIEWARPGPSSLRHEMHLAPDRPKMPRTIYRKKDGLVPIVRSSRHAQGVDRENTRREVVKRYHCRCTHLPCTDGQGWQRRSGKSLGKEKAIPLMDDDGNPIASYWVDDAQQTERGMGRGTPPRFGRWTPLTPPPSPYNYSTPDRTLPFEQFGQDTFFGADVLGSLFRPRRISTQAQDARTPAGYSGPLRLEMHVSVGQMKREIEIHTDVHALQHLRAHAVGLEKMPRVVPRQELKGVTTGMLLEHEARMRREYEAYMLACQRTQRARAPSPEEMIDENMPQEKMVEEDVQQEQVVDEDVSMDMVLIDEDDVEELGPWMPWMPEFVFDGTSSQ